ncbi:sugar transport protein 8-like [Nicotiana tabacum]|uniref:Sugar transport protein 8-like n=1 Tax=Nicotiana tabacum TaxID=4097 RepID=A0A1S4DR73_TOBAC|nr:sugar transport protein 8-like [Nicotiana tomentosiformis]XP_016515629.1 PREDICTED: sugar transport protein 8-like [Nicotiana tabacum]
MANAQTNNSKITIYALSCWIFAAFGGLMFGYDIGISGGVSGMDDFLVKFFPHVYERKLHAKENNYCKYNDQLLQLFTSSLYLSALVASFFASKAATKLGRRPTIFMAAMFFIGGAALSAAADNRWMLICGRILFGIGVGFGNETVPLFLTEVAPIQHRGAVNILFQLFVTIGIFIANLVNYGTSMIHPNGWRMSLGFAAVPAMVLLIGSFVITDTPTSLIERGKEVQGKAALKKIRGVSEVESEYQEIVASCEQAKQVKHPFRNLAKAASIPPLVIAILLQIFQQFTGINAIMFYAPVLFQTMGFKTDGSLLSSVITGLVNVGSTFISIYLVDKVGRRKLLLQACCQMLISQIAIGAILVTNLRETGTLDRTLAAVVVLLVCTYVMSFAWSWGPLGWLIPSETFPLETRTAGFAFAVSTNMLFTSLIAQAFLTMLCTMQAYIFFFFSGWIVVMGLFVIFLLPETKGIPIDSMVESVWMKHPVWKKLF